MPWVSILRKALPQRVYEGFDPAKALCEATNPMTETLSMTVNVTAICSPVSC